MSDVNQAPRGQQYGERQATERRLDAVPMPSGGEPVPEPAGGQPAPPARDPRAVTEQWQPPTNLLGMDPEAAQAATAGLPTPMAPPQALPAANREALSMLPLMPTLERIARGPNTSPAFRRLYRTIKSQLPPEASQRDSL